MKYYNLARLYTVYMYTSVCRSMFLLLQTTAPLAESLEQLFLNSLRKATNPFLRWDVPEVQKAGYGM